MVFTEEDSVVIKFLHRHKGYSARYLENWWFEQTSEEN